MAASTHSSATRTPWRRLLVLSILAIALAVALTVGSLTGGRSRWVPQFALDLEGGTELILTPTATDGSTVSAEDIKQAIAIIRQRVDASGVAEAEISSQGGSNIVVALPGNPSQETLNLVRTSAVLRMRPVISLANPGALTPAEYNQIKGNKPAEAPKAGGTGDSAAPAATPSPSAKGDTVSAPSGAPSAAPSSAPSGQASSAPAASPSANAAEQKPFSGAELNQKAMELADTNHDGKLSDAPTQKPKDGSDPAWASSEQVTYDALTLNCTASQKSVRPKDAPGKALVACGDDGQKYIMGPAEIEGTDLTQATSGFDQQQGRYVVQLEFDKKGAQAFSEITGRLVKNPQPRNLFAIVLDGHVISAPAPETQISDGRAVISGQGVTAETSRVLANQLQFGSLPLQFEVQSEQRISATLGSESLNAGLIAGLVGLILVVLFLLWQYHALGVVAIGSIVLAVGLSYMIICLLSWLMGYRLSMAGVVGLVISVGIAADSFIVFFERIRDEIREGNSLRSAVSHGWHRAKRTIIVSDAVNLTAAVVLYVFAVGSVQGFAFTHGITTVLDLVIVIMFTYPLMTILVRTAFFGGGHKWSGMSPEALGRSPRYTGRGTTRSVDDAERGTGSLAERRAAARRAERAEASIGGLDSAPTDSTSATREEEDK